METSRVTFDSLEGRYQDFCQNFVNVKEKNKWTMGVKSFKHKQAANSDGEYYEGGELV